MFSEKELAQYLMSSHKLRKSLPEGVRKIEIEVE
jgi:hypothetical protein